RGLFTLATCMLLPVETEETCRFELRGDGSKASVLALNNQFWVQRVGTTSDTVWQNKAVPPVRGGLIGCNVNTGNRRRCAWPTSGAPRRWLREPPTSGCTASWFPAAAKPLWIFGRKSEAKPHRFTVGARLLALTRFGGALITGGKRLQQFLDFDFDQVP